MGEIGYPEQHYVLPKALGRKADKAVQESARFNPCCGRNWVPQAPLPFCLGREADNGVNRHGRESPFPKVRLQWRKYEAEKIVKRSRLNKDQLPVAHFGMTMTGDPLATLSVDFAQMLREHLICGIGTPPAFSGPLPLSDCSKRCPSNVGVGGHLD